MKMEHEIRTHTSGVVNRVNLHEGDTIYETHPLLVIAEQDVAAVTDEAAEQADLDEIRPDLHEINERRATTTDAGRPAAVERRRATGQRTARENVDHLCDEGTFVEYGPSCWPHSDGAVPRRNSSKRVRRTG